MRHLIKMTLMILVFIFAQRILAGQFQAGVAKIDITPQISTPLAGYGARNSAFSTGVRDHIFSRALVISDGETRVAIVSNDILLILKDLKDEIAKNVADLNLDGILLTATHTHSGPGGYSDIPIVKIAVMGKYVPEYRKFLVEQISRAIREANGNVKPARFGSAIVDAPGYGRNRRHPEESAPEDPSLGLVKITDISGKPMAYLVNYAVHSTIFSERNLEISGDLAGAIEQAIEEKEPNALAMFFAGPLGDQSPNCQMQEDDVACLNRLGSGLGTEALSGFSKISLTENVRLKLYDEMIDMPEGNLRKGCWVGLKWLMMPMGKELLRERAEIMAIEINDTLIYGVGAELAVEVGFHLKAQHPDKKVMVFAHANDWQGYLLTPEEYDFGGYEACMSLYGRDFGPYLEKKYQEMTSEDK